MTGSATAIERQRLKTGEREGIDEMDQDILMQNTNIASEVSMLDGAEPGLIAKSPALGNTSGAEPAPGSLRGLLIAQIFGQFNDQAWKQIVILLAMATVASEAQKQERTAIVTMLLLVPLAVISLPAGVLADRVSKRSVLIAMKMLELILMLAGAAALYAAPGGDWRAMTVLALVGVQTAFFVPAKYGILPEILPHERLSAGNGLLEMSSNFAMLAGIVGGGLILQWVDPQTWIGPLILSVFSALGLIAAYWIPHVRPARSQGGLGTTVRLASESINSDRVLKLALIGQVFIWTIATLVPLVILAYDASHLKLSNSLSGLPLAALAIGVGAGCVIAGKLSASKVETGLIPLGALGLSITALAFAAFGPGLFGTIAVMTFLGIFSGFLFVPLNALLQWRSPADRRGAVIAMANALVYGGMVLATILAIVLARAEISARGTFLISSIVLAGGFLWALKLTPDTFYRFVLIGLAHTLYRVRFVGRANIPSEGGALLVPNHVTFADGLFIIASTDRPVRFVVWDAYFKRPIQGPMLRAMKAIPISPSGGPKLILQAFRAAGAALDQGELVCLFPEGQLTRTGVMVPFQRGLERIVKGRKTPIIPVHLDRLNQSIFAPSSHRRIPKQIRYPVTISIGAPLPSETPLHVIRQRIRELDTEAWQFRKADRRPLHHQFIRQARKHPRRLAFADLTRPNVSFFTALTGSIALARSLRDTWAGQSNVGILLPPSVGGALVNLAAAIAGKSVVNLNFTTGSAGMNSAAEQAKLQTIVTSRAFLEKGKIAPPTSAGLVYVEDVLAGIGRSDRLKAAALAIFGPARVIERFAGAREAPTADDVATVIFSSGSTGDPKGVVLTHFNIDSNVEAIAQVYRVLPNDRMIAILPFFHSFGYTMFWFAANSGMGAICHPSPLDAAVIGELCEKNRVTVLLATPTFLQLYMRRCAPAQFGSIRLVLAGAEKLPDAMSLAFEDTFGIRPMEGYGLTECAPVVAVNTFDWRDAGYFQPGSRRGYVGQPLPGVSVRIVNTETFEPLGPDTPGLVLVKGPNVMQGYLGRDDLTRAAFHDGWYITGDQGFLSEDGFLKITGRLSRFSKIGGEMVPHGLIEESLQQFSGADEQVFAVTAVGDERKGEKLVVLYTLDEHKVDAAFERLGSLGLPNLFIPKRENFIKVEKLPLLGTGKLDLRGIKRVAEEAMSKKEPVNL